MQTILRPLLLVSFILCYGCESTPDAGLPASSPPRVEHPPATVVDARPAAMVDGRTVSWGDLRPLLSEMAGAEALRELILDRRLDRAIDEHGITIGPNELDAERALLLRSLNDDPNTATRLLDELRARQGLGPTRFRSLMHRNAALRALVRDRVQVTDAAVERMFDTLHGPKRQARLLTLPTLAVARHAIDRINGGEFVGDVAVKLSTDASAARGGLLEPFSRQDASYPEALRSAVWSLEVGELSRPILLEDQYAVVLLEREIEGEDVVLEDVREELEQRARRQQERLLMDQLARDLVRDVSVTIFDDALDASWRNIRRGRR